MHSERSSQSITSISARSINTATVNLAMMQPRTRPVQKFAQAVSQCSAEAAVYGKCIVEDYNAVHKDKCKKEFLKLKDCYLHPRNHDEEGFVKEIRAAFLI
ncbi:hypothetical protein RB597_009673 [Gaeumannomyces tritici]